MRKPDVIGATIKTGGPLTWRFDFAFSTSFEVDSDLIAPHLPKGLTAMEVAPGVALVNLTVFTFLPGGNGTLPEFQELTFNIVVSPDLRRGIPKFAAYVVSLASSSQGHLDHSAEFYKLPVYGLVSEVKIDRNDQVVEFGDSRGRILTMTNCSPDLTFKKSEQYFQVFSSKEGILYVSDVTIRGTMCEHQEKGNAGILYSHPFFRGMDLAGVSPEVYLQMISRPGETGEQIYYPTEPYV